MAFILVRVLWIFIGLNFFTFAVQELGLWALDNGRRQGEYVQVPGNRQHPVAPRNTYIRGLYPCPRRCAYSIYINESTYLYENIMF